MSTGFHCLVLSLLLTGGCVTTFELDPVPSCLEQQQSLAYEEVSPLGFSNKQLADALTDELSVDLQWTDDPCGLGLAGTEDKLQVRLDYASGSSSYIELSDNPDATLAPGETCDAQYNEMVVPAALTISGLMEDSAQSLTIQGGAVGGEEVSIAAGGALGLDAGVQADVLAALSREFTGVSDVSFTVWVSTPSWWMPSDSLGTVNVGVEFTADSSLGGRDYVQSTVLRGSVVSTSY